MWEVWCNYGHVDQEGKCPICKIDEDTTEHVLECNRSGEDLKLNNERGKEWTE